MLSVSRLFSVTGGVTFVGMMADAPRDTGERLAAHESDLGWIKKIGGYVIAVMAAGFAAVFWQLYSLNGQVAGLAASVAARLDAQDAKLDVIAATLAALAGN